MTKHEMRVIGYEAGSFIRVCKCGREWPCPAIHKGKPGCCGTCGQVGHFAGDNKHDCGAPEGGRQAVVHEPHTAAQLLAIFQSRGWSIHMDDITGQSVDPFEELAKALAGEGQIEKMLQLLDEAIAQSVNLGALIRTDPRIKGTPMALELKLREFRDAIAAGEAK